MQGQRTILTQINLTVLNILILLAAGTLWFSSISNYGVGDAWASGFFQNFSTEMFGAFATLILVEIVIGASRRKENAASLEAMRAAITQEVRRIQQANALARLEAAKGASVEVRQPIIHEMVRLDLLEGADLAGANMRSTSLGQANLQGANLFGANLHGAHLWATDLRGANLQFANLHGVNLWQANLDGADLQDTSFNQDTILPDDNPDTALAASSPGRSYWTPETDMRCFTNREHPDFWRSENPRSPAFQG